MTIVPASISLVAYDANGPQLLYIEGEDRRVVTVSTEDSQYYETLCSYHGDRSTEGLTEFIDMGRYVASKLVYQDENTLIYRSAFDSRKFCISLVGIREVSRQMDTIARNRRHLKKPELPSFPISARELREGRDQLKHVTVHISPLIVDPRHCLLIDDSTNKSYHYSIKEGPNHLYLIDGLVCEEKISDKGGVCWYYRQKGKVYSFPRHLVKFMVVSARSGGIFDRFAPSAGQK